MKLHITFILAAFMPATAFAHVGHLGELAGHDHTVLGAAIGATVIAGVLGALLGKKDEDDEADEVEAEDPEAQEA